MNKIEAIITNLNKFDFEQELLRILNNNTTYIMDLERMRLLEGKNSDGSDIHPAYNLHYATYKLKFNPLGVTDLTLTGSFTQEFIMSATEFPVVFGSLDDKSYSLVQKYGENIFGLRKADLQDLKGEILPAIQESIKRLLEV